QGVPALDGAAVAPRGGGGEAVAGRAGLMSRTGPARRSADRQAQVVRPRHQAQQDLPPGQARERGREQPADEPDDAEPAVRLHVDAAGFFLGHGTPPSDYSQRRGIFPVRVKMSFIALCPPSATGSNISGQPPSMTWMPCSWPYRVAAWETLPAPNERCIHTWWIPSSAHSFIVCSATSGRVPITTASTPPGMDLRSWKHASPSTSVALGLTAKTSYPRSRSRW